MIRNRFCSALWRGGCKSFLALASLAFRDVLQMMDEARKLSEQEYDRQRERDKEVPEWLLPDEDLLSRLRKSTVLGPMCREWWAREASAAGRTRPTRACAVVK